MGYLSIQIFFFLLLAAALGFIIGWLLRGSRFQTELQELDGRWRTKLGEVEGERDRFVAELTHANDAKAKLEAELKRQSGSQGAKVAAVADNDQLTAGLKSDLAAKSDELSKLQAELADSRRNSGDAGRLGKELAAASERAATLEASLKDAKAANATCKSEVDRLNAEIAALKSSGGSAAAGGAMGLMSGVGGNTSSSADSGGGGAGGGGQSSGSGSSYTQRAASPSHLAEAGGRGFSGGDTSKVATSGAGGGRAGAASGKDENEGVRNTSSSADSGRGGAGGGGQSSGSGSSYTQRAASPSHLAEAGGQGFSGGDASKVATSGAGGGRAGAASGEDENEGIRPAALSAARGGQADDLKKISGVGPKLEKTLNGLGIYHFAQIAEFNPDNVAWVDRHLRFKGRIARDNWIDQAKVLAAGGETEFSKRK